MSVTDPKMEIVLTARNMTAKAFKELETQTTRLRKEVFSLNGAITTLAGAAGLVVFADKALTAFSKVDSGLIGIQKTTDATNEQMAQLKERIQDMASVTPVATEGLLNIAQAAGQLGVRGVENISLFTETIAKLQLTTDLVGENAAKSIARILNTSGESIDKVDELGSAIVALGNNMAATESEIVQMASEISRSTAAFKVSSEASVAYGAALKDMGARAELSGSAIGRAMIEIEKAIVGGGKKLEYLQQVTGMTGDQLEKTFKTDAAAVFNAWIKGAGRMVDSGRSAISILEEFGMSGVEQVKGLTPLIANVGKLEQAFSLASNEIEDATALNEEAIKASESFASQMKMTMNVVDRIASSIGAGLAPEIIKVAKNFRDWTEANEKFIENDLAKHLQDVSEKLRNIQPLVAGVATGMFRIIDGFTALPPWLQTTGLIGGVLFGKTGWAAVAATSAVVGQVRSFNKAMKENVQGRLDFLEEHKKYLESIGMSTEETDRQIKELKKSMNAVDDAMYDIDFGSWSDGLDKADDKANDLGKTLKTLEEINRDYAKSLKEIEINWMNLDAINLTDKEQRMLINEDDYDQAKEWLDKWEQARQDQIDKETKAHEDMVKAQQRAQERALKKTQEAYAGFFDTVQGYTFNIIDDYENMGDSLVGIAKRTAKEMAAAFLAEKLIMPVALDIGSALGLSWQGTSFADMAGLGSGGGSGFKIPGLSDIGKLFGFGGKPASTTAGYGATAPGIMDTGTGFGSVPFNWSGLASSAITGGVIAGGAMITSKVLAGWGERTPRAYFYGGDREELTFNKSKRDMVPYEYAVKNPYERLDSDLYDYGISVDHAGNDTALKKQFVEYFDSVFSAVDQIIPDAMETVLSEHKNFLGSAFGERRATGTGVSLSELSEDVFSEMLGSLLIEVFPDADTVTRTVREMVGTEVKNMWDIQNPDTYLGRGEYKTPFSGKAAAGMETVVSPVYEDIERRASVMAEKFNEAFFDAITSEEGTSWDAFVRFGEVVTETDDFMDKFNRQLAQFGESTTSAYLNIEQITGVLNTLDEMADALFGESALEQQLQAVTDSFASMADVLADAHVTATELTEAEKTRNEILGATISGISASSVTAGLQSGKSQEQVLSEIISDSAMDYAYQMQSKVILEGIRPQLEQMGADFNILVDGGMSHVEAAAKVLKDAGYSIDSATDKITVATESQITASMWNQHMGTSPDSMTYGEYWASMNGDDSLSNVTSVVQGMIDGVMGIKYSADQLDVQNIMGQLEAVFSGVSGTTAWLSDFAADIASVQGLDIYKGQLQTFGNMKASVYGMSSEFRQMQIQNKYGADFIANAAGMSANQFLTAIDTMGIGISEASSDMQFLADILKETAREFADINSSVTDTRKGLQANFGMSGTGRTLEELMKEFNSAAGTAMSADADLAAEGAARLSSIANPLLSQALKDAPTAYEYNRVYSKMIRTLEDVEEHTGEQAKLQGLGDPGAQLAELEKIAKDISSVDQTIGTMLTDTTFQSFVASFNQQFDEGGVWNTLNASILSLPDALAALLSTGIGEKTKSEVGQEPVPYTNIPSGAVKTYDPYIGAGKAVGNTAEWKGYVDQGMLTPDVAKELLNAGVSARAMIDAYEDAAGGSTGLTEADVKKYAGIPGYASGGYHSGGLAMVGESGPEIVDFSSPGRIYSNNDSMGLVSTVSDLLDEIKALRQENKILMKQSAGYLKKISNFYRVSRNDSGSALRVETV